jgi:hypothetical protein
VTSNYDYVFLCGDLNFRINKSREEVLDFVSKTWGEISPVDFRPELSKLLEADQLKLSLANSRGTIIHHFMCTNFYSKENVLFSFRSDTKDFQRSRNHFRSNLQIHSWNRKFRRSQATSSILVILIFDLIEMILTFALLSIFSTDRILWKERKGISVRCDHYDVAKQLKCSDHFPVWAAFQVPIKPGRETYTTL